MIASFITSLLPGLGCIFLAAFFKAVADTLYHHFDTSIFKKKDTAFWNPLHRHNDAVKKIFGYPLDAAHLAYSGMIVSFIVATLFQTWLAWYWHVLVFGLVFNGVFNLFYNKVLRK
jgi:hypothetical protein